MLLKRNVLAPKGGGTRLRGAAFGMRPQVPGGCVGSRDAIHAPRSSLQFARLDIAGVAALWKGFALYPCLMAQLAFVSAGSWKAASLPFQGKDGSATAVWSSSLEELHLAGKFTWHRALAKRWVRWQPWRTEMEKTAVCVFRGVSLLVLYLCIHLGEFFQFCHVDLIGAGLSVRPSETVA